MIAPTTPTTTTSTAPTTEPLPDHVDDLSPEGAARARQYFAPTLAERTVPSSANRPGGVHLSMDQASPFYGGWLCQKVGSILLDGVVVKGCWEASEPDGFVVQRAFGDALRDAARPDAEWLDPEGTPLRRFRRRGAVLITFAADRAPIEQPA